MNDYSKTKTPLSLLNEITRNHQVKFSLINEIVENNSSKFFMKLELDNGQVYISSGPSIKKSQHAVAQLALVNSNYIFNSMKNFSIKYNKEDFVNQITRKSEISIVYEFAGKLKKNLNFKFNKLELRKGVLAECFFDSFHSIAEAYNQPQAKLVASSNMLLILKDNLKNYSDIYDQIINYKHQKIKRFRFQKSNSFIEDKKKSDYGRNLSPVSQLMRLCNNNIEKKLNFIVTRNENNFHSTCQFNEHITAATASNQKLAKNRSAELMLVKLGYFHVQ